MIKKKQGGMENGCLKRCFFTLYTVLFILFPVSIHAENDLLLLPSVKSEKASASLLLDIAKAGKRLVAVGERGHILCSDDNGVSWRQANVPTGITLTAVCFPTPEQGWATGHDGVVLHTGDGGDSWVIQTNGFEESKLNLAHVKMLLSAKEAEWTKATEERKESLTNDMEDLRNRLQSMETANTEGACCNPLLDVWFKNEKEGFVIGAYGLFFHTNDGGINWTPWWDRIDNPDNLHLNAIAGAGGVLYIAGESGKLYRSMDDGKNWESLESPMVGSYFGIVASPNEDFVIAFGVGGKMAHSRDRGENWKLIQTKAGAALSGGLAQKSGEVLIVSYSGIVMAGSGNTGMFAPKKIGAGWNAVADTGDGHIVLVGLKGALRVPFDGAKQGG